MSVSPGDYPETLRHLHTKRALVLLVADLLDFPGSVHTDVLTLLGTNKRIVLVGNKADLLPQDSPGYLLRVEAAMRDAFMTKCNTGGMITYDPKDISSILVSARTGFNIEALVNLIYASWRSNHYRYA